MAEVHHAGYSLVSDHKVFVPIVRMVCLRYMSVDISELPGVRN